MCYAIRCITQCINYTLVPSTVKHVSKTVGVSSFSSQNSGLINLFSTSETQNDELPVCMLADLYIRCGTVLLLMVLCLKCLYDVISLSLHKFEIDE